MKKWLLLFVLFLIFPVQANAISAEGKVTSPTSIKITLKGKTEYKYWRIKQTDYNNKEKTIRILKTSTRHFTINNLKKNKKYEYVISFGNKEKGKFKPKRYDYTSALYTRLSMADWPDYADDTPDEKDLSISYYDIEGYCRNDGLPAKGIQIYRKEKGGSFKRIKTIKKKSFTYRDKTVKKGKTYYYKMRCYGTYKGKTIYSPWTSTYEWSSFHQYGKYTSKIITSEKKYFAIKLTSDKYNRKLSMKPDAFCFRDTEEYVDCGLKITKYSLDGKTWKIPGKEIALNPGKSIWLRFEETNGTHDLRELYSIRSKCVTYGQWEHLFYLDLNGSGLTPVNVTV